MKGADDMDVRIFLYISACFVLAVYVSAVIKIRLNTASWIKGILLGLAVLPFSVYVYKCVKLCLFKENNALVFKPYQQS